MLTVYYCLDFNIIGLNFLLLKLENCAEIRQKEFFFFVCVYVHMETATITLRGVVQD